jgi:hypothetical protein
MTGQMQMRRGAMLGRNWTLTAGEEPLAEMRWKWPAPGNVATVGAGPRHWKLERVRHEPLGSFVALDEAAGAEVARLLFSKPEVGVPVNGRLEHAGKEPLTLRPTPSGHQPGVSNRHGEWALFDADDEKLIEFRTGSDRAATSGVEINVLRDDPDVPVLVALCVHALQYRGSHRPSHIGDQMSG